MPKLKVNETEMKNRVLRGYISKYMDLYDIRGEVLAVKLRFTRRTLQNKRKRPETFTLDELRKLCTILKFTTDEKAEIL